MNPFVAVIIAGLTPFIVLGLLVTGLSMGLVLWQPPVIWTVQSGTPAVGIQNSVTAMSGDDSGLYAAGVAGSNTSKITSGGYLFLSKYDFNGQQIWTQHPTDNATVSQITGVGVGTDGVYVAGSLNGTAFVARYDLSGKQVWSGSLPSFGFEVSTVSIATSGVYVGGLGQSNSMSASPILVSDYAHNGTLVWTKSLGNETGSKFNQVSILAEAVGFYLAGADGLFFGGLNGDTHAFLSKYDFNGVLLSTRLFSTPSSICSCAPAMMSGDATGVYVAAIDLNIGGFVEKYSLSGDMLWKSLAEAPDHAGVSTLEISTDASGSYLAMTTGKPHGFVMRYDSSGNQLWTLALQNEPNAVWAGPRATYVGGASLPENRYAIVSAIDQSSSLVFFGLNPPFSFVLLGSLIGVAAVSLWAFRRFKGKRVRPRSATLSGGMKIPTDVIKLLGP
jgi:outer membrane protein assembly factor BamB